MKKKIFSVQSTYPRMKLIVCCAILPIFSSCAHIEISQIEAKAPFALSASSSNKTNWQLDETRSDEFTASSIDYNKWKANPKHVQTWSWDNDSNASVDNGILHIKMTYSPHQRPISDACAQGKTIKDANLYFKSAMLESFSSGTTGYYEARIKGVSHFPGFSPAFWMYSEFDDSKTQEGAVRYSEIDVVELQQRQNFQSGNHLISDHNLHTALTKANGKPNPTGRAWRRPGKFHEQENVNVLDKDPAKHFMVYGVHVTEHDITWYVDDKKVGWAKNNYWKQLDMHVALSLGLRKPFTEFKCNGFVPIDPIEGVKGFSADSFNKAPPTMYVDYVRVWRESE
jgi:beta-glucanase (GH16 family)